MSGSLSGRHLKNVQDDVSLLNRLDLVRLQVAWQNLRTLDRVDCSQSELRQQLPHFTFLSA